MAGQVDQHEVVVGVLPTLAAWLDVVLLQLFAVEQRLAADSAGVALTPGDLLLTGDEVAGLGPIPRRPVRPQARVVRRGSAFDQHVPPNMEPSKLEEVRARV